MNDIVPALLARRATSGVNVSIAGCEGTNVMDPQSWFHVSGRHPPGPARRR
jgi:hypothetical protein